MCKDNLCTLSARHQLSFALIPDVNHLQINTFHMRTAVRKHPHLNEEKEPHL